VAAGYPAQTAIDWMYPNETVELLIAVTDQPFPLGWLIVIWPA
jgi:hypothetical protein